MIIPYKERIIQKRQAVQVYRNLHNGMFSIRCAGTGLVLGHGDCFIMRATGFHVGEKQRQKVISEKSKNVHAWVCGAIYEETVNKSMRAIDILYYNPYENGEFILLNSGIIPTDGLFLFEGGQAYILEEVEASQDE